MSQGPAYPTRSAYTGKLPERTVSGFQGNAPSGFQSNIGATQPFGQSAPAFGRQQQQQQLAQTGFPPYSQYGGATIGRQSVEKDANILNDLSDEQKDEINETFTLFDLDRDRHLDFHELRVALRALGFSPHKNEVLQIMSANGVPKPAAQRMNGNNRVGQQSFHPSQMLIPQNAFTRLAAQKMLDRDPREEVERAFYLFDLERKDYINLEDLRRVSRELGETSLEEQELINMIEEFDYEGIGGVSKEAFFGICLQ